MKNKAVVPMVGIGVTALLAGGMGGYFTGKGVLESGGRKGFMAEEFCGGAFFGRDDSKEIADKFIPDGGGVFSHVAEKRGGGKFSLSCLVQVDGEEAISLEAKVADFGGPAKWQKSIELDGKMEVEGDQRSFFMGDMGVATPRAVSVYWGCPPKGNSKITPELDEIPGFTILIKRSKVDRGGDSEARQEMVGVAFKLAEYIERDVPCSGGLEIPSRVPEVS